LRLFGRAAHYIGFLVVSLMIAVASLGYFVVRGNIIDVSTSGDETILWSAVQTEIELLRFRRTLADFSLSGSEVTADVVNERFDILWSRVSLFDSGTAGTRLSEYDQAKSRVGRLQETMEQTEAAIVGLQDGQSAKAREIMAMYDAHGGDLRNFSRDVLHGEDAEAAKLREELNTNSQLLGLMSVITMITSLVLLFIFARESQRFRLLAEQNETLLLEAKKTSEAKSQFLTMMSHELRTPMNGVLGMLALISQNGLSKSQLRLVEMAERSGRHMNELLGDILDFSALQDNTLKLDEKPFEPALLLQAIEDKFNPIADREGIVFETRLDPSCPQRVMGDFMRLRQAYTHLASYLLETAGTQSIGFDLSYEDGRLIGSISFDYSSVSGDWEPELIMGDPQRKGDKFATAALGPAVARALVEHMGGRTRLHCPAEDRIAVLVCVPTQELVLDHLNISIVTKSAALKAICKATIRAENIRVLEEDSNVTPNVVLIEAGGDIETSLVKQFATLYPHAMLVAIGRPQNPDDFDEVVDVPIDIKIIKRSGFMRLAS